METVIRNVLAVNPEGEIAAVDIGIQDGVIARIGSIEAAAQVIDGTGLHAFPGFCDLHSHLRDPGYTYKEDLESGAASAAAGGYTDVCCMPNTKPPLDSVQIISDVRTRGEKTPIGIHPVGAITRGMKGKELTDFVRLREAGAVAFSDDGLPVENTAVMLSALEAAKQDGILLMLHEENRDIAGKGAVNAGENAEKAGLPGIPAAAEEEMVARDLYLAEKHGGRVHFCHISTAGSVELIRRYKARGLGNVTCETAPHYFSATDELILSRNPNTKMNPPLRSETDRQAVIAGLQDGTIDAIATDHAPHSAREKDRSMEKAPFGIIGFETALALAITHLYAPGLLSLQDIARLMSAAPRRILGLPGGSLRPGVPADVVLCDLGACYTYDQDMIVSRSANSPFIGMDLQGRVVRTIRKGNTIYDRPPYL